MYTQVLESNVAVVDDASVPADDAVLSRVNDDSKAKAFEAEITELENDLVECIGRSITNQGEERILAGGKFYAVCKREQAYYGTTYSVSYFKTAANRARQRICVYYCVKPDSVRVDTSWLASYLIRECLAAVEGVGPEHAKSFSFWELRELYEKNALVFKASTLEFALDNNWIPFFVEITNLRRHGKPVTSSQFKELVAKRVQAIAEMAEKSPEDNAKENDKAFKQKLKTAERKRSVVSEKLFDALGSGAMKPADVADMLRHVASECNVVVDSKSLGYSPKSFTAQDCKPFAREIYKSGDDGATVTASLILALFNQLIGSGKVADSVKLVETVQKRIQLASESEATLVIPKAG